LALKLSRFNQSSCTRIADQRALVGDDAKLEIEAYRDGLIGEVFEHPITAHASAMQVGYGPMIGNVGRCLMLSHVRRSFRV
jgi:hypothetical protein